MSQNNYCFGYAKFLWLISSFLPNLVKIYVYKIPKYYSTVSNLINTPDFVPLPFLYLHRLRFAE